jgi:hypothetical protein
MTRADDLAGEIWSAISDLIMRSIPGREITFGKVIKRDAAKKLIWVEEFGDLSIPLVSFGHSFAYFDTEPTGVATAGQPIDKQTVRRSDPTGNNPNFATQIIVPRVGQMVAILNPRGSRRFPMCVGVFQSKGYWQGEV